MKLEVEMAYARHGEDCVIPASEWMPAGKSAGRDAMLAKPYIMVGHLTNTAFKFQFVASEDGMNYYEHKGKKEDPLVFRSVCSYCVFFQLEEYRQPDEHDITVFHSLSGDELTVIRGIKTNTTMAKVREMIKANLVEAGIVSAQADVKITDPIADGRTLLKKACSCMPNAKPSGKKCIGELFIKK